MGFTANANLEQLTLVISSIFGSISTTKGFGNHTWNIDTKSHSFSTLLLIMNQTGFWSIFGAAWSKTSFAITLLRITTGKGRWLIWFIIATVNITLTLAAIIMWVQCNPPRRSYDPFIEGECWDGSVIVFYNSFVTAWSGLADIVLALMPWWIIARNSMNMKERIGLLVCMSLGVFAGLTSFAKIVTLSAITNDDMIHTVPLNILGIGEAAVTIVAASIPVLRALLTIQNPSKAGSSGLISGTPKTATSPGGWREREYEILGKESEHYSSINLAELPDSHISSSSRSPASPNEDPWRRF
ncbi:uncharacterized protein DNG_02368 [Cephalotrichum gorgonifer]|uniref:Rhodopsin domain-containing protein n=1 Tax=Cephalotrichum gorgonifer TaxID=2041049 RepID=A0AAE8SSJ3_9PEZI|nr:uncharacterized protein DNG_02368 [Cephalotrichum gorgonifer]